MFKLNKTYASVGVSSALMAMGLSGCATTADPEQFEAAKSEFMERNNISGPRTDKVVVHNDVPYVDNTPIEYRKGSEHLVDVHASGATLSDAMIAPASAIGYSVSFTSEVNPQQPVNMQLRNVGAVDAIKKLAMSAGYHAVVDERNNSVIVSKEATWVFRVPPSIFDGDVASYDVSMSNEGTGGGDGEEVGSQSETASAFSVTGEATSEERGNFEAVVKRLLAEDEDEANATFSWASGTITVSGDVFVLNRVKTLLDEMVRNALTQVEVQTLIAQVRLTDDQSYGINWNNFVDASSSLQASVGGVASAISDSANLSATLTKSDIQTVVRALAEKNKVSVMASPSVVTKNNKPATIFNGSKIPFLGKVESTLSSGTTSVSAESQYASDGLSMSVIPSALDGNTVSLKMVPSLTDVGDFRVFAFGNEDEGGVRLEVPETYQRQMFIDVTAQSGQTIILGGTRTSNRDRAASGLPGAINSNTLLSRMFGGVQNSDSEEELVVMVTTNIIPPPQYNSLVSESL